MVTVFAPRPKLGDASPFHFPRAAVFTLKNGLTVEYFATHSQLITVALILPGGSAAEPRGREGVAGLTADLRSEGTAVHTGEEFAVALDRIGAAFGTTVSERADVTTMQLPAADLLRGLTLLTDTVTTPSFPVAEFDRLRAEGLQEASNRLSEPGMRADLGLRTVTFAENDRASIARDGTIESLTAISYDDVRAYDVAYRTPVGATLVIGGLIEEDLESLLERSGLAAWAGEAAPSIPPSPAAPVARRVIIDHRPDSVQTEMRLGMLMPGIENNDFGAFQVAAQALGGSINSRLSSVLREEKGYTYGIYAYALPLPQRSRLLISTPVATEVTGDALEHLVRIVDEVRSGGISQAELVTSKDEMLQGPALTYQTVASIVSERVNQLILGLDQDFFDTHRAQIAAVTTDDVRRVFQNWAPAERLSAVFVGDSAHVLPVVERIWGSEGIELRGQ